MDYSIPTHHTNHNNIQIPPNNPPKILPIILIFSLIGTIGTTYFYLQYKSTQKRLTNPAEAVKAETKILVDKVGKHILLPTGEEPTIATISDKDKLSGQPFFTNAKKGDKVLIFNGAKKAILYDPEKDLVLEVAPINQDTAAAAPADGSTLGATAVATPIPQPTASPLHIGLYNGTNVTGLTLSVEKALKDKNTNFITVTRDNTKKKEYDKTLVIDITGIKRTEASQIASFLGATVGTIPAEEQFPATTTDGQTLEIVVIIGKDFVKTSPSPAASPTPLLFP